MSKRITLISYMEQTELDKIKSLMSNINMKTCKVPYGIDDDNRYNIDNLPYHITIFANNKDKQYEMIYLTKKTNIDKIEIKVNDIKIMKGRYDSFVLYLSIEDNSEIRNLQRIFFKEFPNEKYNPDDFTFHITLDIDKDYNKVVELQKQLKKNFKSFYLKFNKLALYDYPGDLIKIINMK